MLAIRAENVKKCYKIYPSPLALLAEVMTGGRVVRHAVREALSGVCFELEQGQTLGVIGSNGAGKSTLLRLMGRITEPTGGEIEVHGRVSALMELTAGFHPEFTGRDNIAIKCALMGMSREEAREKFERIVEFSELARFIDQPVRTYSSGMYVRLGFAVAIMVEPDVILIDEVLAVGDQHFQDKCIRRIRQLKEQGRSIVIVSHEMKPVRYLCDRVLWLEGGRIADFGAGTRVVDEYIDSVRSAGRRVDAGRIENTTIRSGGGEARIESVRILDISGIERFVFATGDRMDVEIIYSAARPISRPTFLVTIFRNDDVEVYSCSSKIDGTSPARISGRGRASLSIPRLPLLSGSYEVSVEIQDTEGIRPYDAHYRLYPFSVRNPVEDLGLCKMEHQFFFQE